MSALLEIAAGIAAWVATSIFGRRKTRRRAVSELDPGWLEVRDVLRGHARDRVAVMHACPAEDGLYLTACCGRSPGDFRQHEAMTYDLEAVTCQGQPATTRGEMN